MSEQARGAPPAAALLQIVYGPFIARALWAVAELGVADVLEERPRCAAEVAAALELSEDPVERLLVALVPMGVVGDDGDGVYRNGPLGELLRSDVPGSLRAYVRYAWNLPLLRAWDGILDVLRSGEPSFAAANGAPFFEYLRQNRDLGARFAAAMTSLTEGTLPALVAALRAERFGVLVDVGGGEGLLLAALLEAVPTLRGVLLDLPAVVEQAHALLAARGVADRCEVVAGSFFDDLPCGGDAYVLRTVLHDWPTEDAVRILERVRAAMPVGGTLLVVESVLPDGPEPHPARGIDLHMMVVLGGRERTESEWRRFLGDAGFGVRDIRPAGGPSSVIEAVRA